MTIIEPDENKRKNMVPAQFRLPKLLKFHFKKFAKQIDRDMSDIVRDAILREMLRIGSYDLQEDLSQAMNDPNDPFGKMLNNEMDSSPGLQEAFEQLQAQQVKLLPNSYIISLPEHTKEGFEFLSKQFKYPSPTRMIEDLVHNVTIHPDKAKDLLFSDVDRILREAQRAADAAEEEESQKAG